VTLPAFMHEVHEVQTLTLFVRSIDNTTAVALPTYGLPLTLAAMT
jgi:hypothetical protein